MERKQFINHLLVGGSGIVISSTFLYGCFKTDNALPHRANQPAPFLSGDVFLLASDIRLIRDEAFGKKFHCSQIATCSLQCIIRKAPFPFDRQLQRKAVARSLHRAQAKPFTLSYYYSHEQGCEYAITDLRHLGNTIKVPVHSDRSASGYPVVRLLNEQELEQWFDATMIKKLTNT